MPTLQPRRSNPEDYPSQQGFLHPANYRSEKTHLCFSCGANFKPDQLCNLHWCKGCCATRHITCARQHHHWHLESPLCFNCDRQCPFCPCRTDHTFTPTRPPDEHYHGATEVIHLAPGSGVFHADHPVRAKRSGYPRFCGLEIEVCHASVAPVISPLNLCRKKWGMGVVHDGSLPSGGFEIQTSPSNGNKLIKQIQQLGEALKVQKATVTNSAGLHVHVDARDFAWADLRRLLLTFATIEAYLFKGILHNRQAGRYCVPMANNVKQHIFDELAAGTPPDKGSAVTTIYGTPVIMPSQRLSHYNEHRYTALNLHTYLRRSTVEFRLHHGSLDPTVQLNWTGICSSIVSWAKQHKEVDVVKFYKAEAGKNTGLTEIVGPDLSAWWAKRIEHVAKSATRHVPGLL